MNGTSFAMSVEAMEQALKVVPRVALDDLPTPLLRLERLGNQLGRDLYLKRDDRLGPLVGGNKTRKLELLLREAAIQGATRVVTVGGPQSNHCRLTAAAARLCGIEAHLLLIGERPASARGNLLLDELVGARLHWIPGGPMADGPCSFAAFDEYARERAAELVDEHYFVPIGGSNGLGSIGYSVAALELHRQTEDLGIERAIVVVAVGSGGTMAGLWAGCTMLGGRLRVVGVDVARLWTDLPQHVARLATEISQRVGSIIDFSTEPVPVFESVYVGQGYGKPTPGGRRAIELLAATEGVVLEPAYTAKAFAGLLDLLEEGRLGRDEPVIFVHTGGLPGFFAG